MVKLLALNRLRWPLRIPIKWALFGLTFLVVCFPYPSRFIDHIRHWSDPNALIDPTAPAILPLVEELKAGLSDDLSPRDTLKAVERFVLKKIPYDWDWNTWGTADYLPTVTEAIEMGREDCDGRAVVAASLLRNLGYDARIVTDFAHVWVKTEHGETMGPGKKKAVVATDKGLKLQRGALAELPRALAYGIGPFPLGREVILVVALWLLMLRPRGGPYPACVALVFLIAGLLLLKAGGRDYLRPVPWQQLLGAANFAAGLAILLVWNRGSAVSTVRGESARDKPTADTDGRV